MEITSENIGQVWTELEQNDFDFDAIMEVIQEMNDANEDFEVNDYRFIHTDEIDQIQQDELTGDLYILGCFTDWFIAETTNIDLAVIQALQKAEASEELGKLMEPHIEEIQSKYASMDGYGHHFNHYDGNEIELGDYHIFRTN